MPIPIAIKYVSKIPSLPHRKTPKAITAPFIIGLSGFFSQNTFRRNTLRDSLPRCHSRPRHSHHWTALQVRSKELITANGLNEYDFGARQYCSAVPGFTKPDRMYEKYYWLSPYLYCANNPVNAFDPDGNVIIFINGMHFGDGGNADYWEKVDETFKTLFKDNETMYIDGSFGGLDNTLLKSMTGSNNISAKNRKNLGYLIGKLQAEGIYKNLMDNETIKIITHSMGGAAAKGFIEALIQYARSYNQDPRIVLELDLAPFEWWQQKGNDEVETHVISHWNDIIAGASFMKNAHNHRTGFLRWSLNPLSEHSIKSFNEDIKRLIRDGIIPLYIDNVRQN